MKQLLKATSHWKVIIFAYPNEKNIFRTALKYRFSKHVTLFCYMYKTLHTQSTRQNNIIFTAGGEGTAKGVARDGEAAATRR